MSESIFSTSPGQTINTSQSQEGQGKKTLVVILVVIFVLIFVGALVSFVLRSGKKSMMEPPVTEGIPPSVPITSGSQEFPTVFFSDTFDAGVLDSGQWYTWETGENADVGVSGGQAFLSIAPGGSAPSAFVLSPNYIIGSDFEAGTQVSRIQGSDGSSFMFVFQDNTEGWNNYFGILVRGNPGAYTAYAQKKVDGTIEEVEHVDFSGDSFSLKIIRAQNEAIFYINDREIGRTGGVFTGGGMFSFLLDSSDPYPPASAYLDFAYINLR